MLITIESIDHTGEGCLCIWNTDIDNHILTFFAQAIMTHSTNDFLELDDPSEKRKKKNGWCTLLIIQVL